MWAAPAPESIELKLVRANNKEEQSEFHPVFTHSIFGEEETIFGYRDLVVQLHFASGSLKQYLHVEYAEKFPETATVKADNPEKILFEFIPPDYVKIEEDFVKQVEKDVETFTPHGEKIGMYQFKPSKVSKGKQKEASISIPEHPWSLVNDDEVDEGEPVYEAYAATWKTPGFREFHSRMQIFLLFFIDGAQYIDSDDLRWEFITLFERIKEPSGKHSYHFIGFTSFYTFFHWPDSRRLRISQFLILPPFQGKGHGTALYSLAYNKIIDRSDVSELAVEDPAEAFEDMRDKMDLITLLKSHEFDNIMLPVDKPAMEAIRRKYKIADRQFYRLLEMIALLHLDPTDEATMTAFRLDVKKRIFTFNREQLSQLDPDEKKEKLQETFESVVDGYGRVLQRFK